MVDKGSWFCFWSQLLLQQLSILWTFLIFAILLLHRNSQKCPIFQQTLSAELISPYMISDYITISKEHELCCCCQCIHHRRKPDNSSSRKKNTCETTTSNMLLDNEPQQWELLRPSLNWPMIQNRVSNYTQLHQFPMVKGPYSATNA